MKAPRIFLIGGLAFAGAGTMPVSTVQAESLMDAPSGEFQVAQLYDPRDVQGTRHSLRVFIDEYGRRITVNRRGDIVAVEEPREGLRPEYRDAPMYRDTWIPEDSNARYSDIPEDPYGSRRGRGGYDRRYEEQANGYPLDERNYGSIERSPLPPASEMPPEDRALPDYGLAPNDEDLRPAVPDDGFSGSYPTPAQQPPSLKLPTGQGAKAKIAAFQVLLDRAGASPGVIDGRNGSNVAKAASIYTELTGQMLDPLDEAAINAALDMSGGPAFVDYTISPEDAAAALVASIPDDYAHKAQLEHMSFTSVEEMLAERFHMDEAYLREINQGVDFRQPGAVIRVVNIGRNIKGEVVRIVADKGRKQVRGYGADGRLIVAYPSTIGSSDNPSPSGTVQVERIALNPNYTYNPKINFKQGNNDKVLTIPPGPNGPVGTVWIALSKPTYGIHGTPEPSKIGKTSSHGCVRLTNWDAQELAKLVKRGVTVEFHE